MLISTSVSGCPGCHQSCGRGTDHGYLALHAGQVRGVVQRRKFAGVACKKQKKLNHGLSFIQQHLSWFLKYATLFSFEIRVSVIVMFLCRKIYLM